MGFVTLGNLLLSLGKLFYKILSLELIIRNYFVQGTVLNILCLILTITPGGRHYHFIHLIDESHGVKAICLRLRSWQIGGIGVSTQVMRYQAHVPEHRVMPPLSEPFQSAELMIILQKEAIFFS